MPQSQCYRPVHIKPVTGALDVRSNPDEVPFGGYRWVLNAEVTQKLKLCRARGWRRIQDKEQYNNEDLHDQNVAAGRDNPESYLREPIQFLYQADTPAGFSKLFAGTQNRLYVRSNANGNWRIISDTYGGTAVPGCSEIVRWTAGTVGQTVVLSNARDAILSHVIDGPDEADGQGVSLIPDLVKLNITKAEIVISWNDIIILFNVVQDGTRVTDRVIWSDYQRPLSWSPDVGVSLAGYKDLGAGELILGVAPLKDSLAIYTTRGIWEMRAASGPTVFSFGRRYQPTSEGSRCLAYPNTLVSDGDSNFYFGRDGIYQYNIYSSYPERVDWIHRASAIIFDEIDASRCNAHIGGFDTNKKSIWWSWVKAGESCPSQTLLVNIEYPFVSYVDAGFTAFVNHSPRFNKSLRDFILELCICTPDELIANEDGFWNREGGTCFTVPAPVCAVRPANYTSGTGLTIEDFTVEDWTAEPDADSLFALVGARTPISECDAEYRQQECNSTLLFAMASSEDMCLKESADVYYRQVCTGFTGCGTYALRGYRTLLRSGPIDLKIPDDDKNLNRFAIDLHAALQTVPSEIRLRIGVSAQPLDPNIPNTGKRVILWEDQDPKELDYDGEETEAEHRKLNTRPSTEKEWGLYLVTRYVYFEVEVVNPKSTPPDLGGAVCFSRFTFDAAAAMRCT